MEKEGVLTLDATVYLSSLGVAFFILIPFSIKWKINLKYAFVGAFLFAGIAGSVLSLSLLGRSLYFPWTLLAEAVLVVFLTVATIIFSFSRDPERTPPERRNIIVSPADGKVLYVKKIKNGEVPFSEKKGRKFKLEELTRTNFFKNEEACQIGILMTFLDVHVIRAPIAGLIKFLTHIPGKFISLRKEEAVLVNERVTTLVENRELGVAVVQIASRLVRRIVPYVKVAQDVKLGERVGIIKFGSQVDVLIPKVTPLKICVKQGDKVLAGVSIIAEY